jgi:ribosomal protein S8
MARIDTLTNFLTDVSNAIRQKTGGSNLIPASTFDTEILSIPTKETYQEKSITIRQDGNYSLLPDSGYGALSKANITVNTTERKQSKSISIDANGSYQVNADEGYDALGTVAIDVDVQAQGEDQNIPLYFIETTDNGNLVCINNYSEFLYVPYVLNEQGELIVVQDDDDNAVYSINANQELEVVVNG